jgi:hypothetical protein
MFAESNSADITMLIVLATFTPAFFSMQLLELLYYKLYWMFFGQS